MRWTFDFDLTTWLFGLEWAASKDGAFTLWIYLGPFGFRYGEPPVFVDCTG